MILEGGIYMFKRGSSILIMLLLLLLITGQVGAESLMEYTPKDKSIASTNWEKHLVEAIGFGSYHPNDPNIVSKAQGLMLAREAAKSTAYRELLEKVQGVQIDSETTVKKAVTEDDVIKKKISGVLRGMRIIKEEVVGETGYRILARVEFYGKDGVVKAIFPTIKAQGEENSLAGRGEDFGVRDNNSSMVESNYNQYTGVIINATNLIGVESALLPKVYATNGKLVYGVSRINVEGVIVDGIVGYNRSLADAKVNSRVGDKPLIINAFKVRGDSRTDLIISNKDAKLMNRVGYNNEIFKERRVVVVIN